jgi:UDP-N-acetylglucosamine acyltransferase
MVKIDSRAVVSPDAILGDGVVVESGAIVEGGAIIGDGCRIKANAIISGSVRMGKNNEIGYGAVIGAPAQDLGYRGEVTHVEIGEGNTIREYATIHRGAREGGVTRIGNRCYLMVGAHVAHDCVIEDDVILVNNVLLAGHVRVGRQAFLGGSAVVHQHVRIGRLAILQGNAGVGMDVPPFCMAVGTNRVSGLNRVGLRRAKISNEVRAELETIFAILYREGRNRLQAIETMAATSWNSTEAREFIDFILGTRRGLCRFFKDVEASAGKVDL